MADNKVFPNISYLMRLDAISANWGRAACLLRLGYGAPGEVLDLLVQVQNIGNTIGSIHR
jgi:hypothetical protein